MHFPASCPALLWLLQPCPFHITTVLWHQINLKSQCLNKLSHLIITLISLYSIKINNSSVSTLSEAMNYILHTSALSCSRTDSTTMSWSTTFALLIQTMFFTYIWHLLPDANSRCNKICCHANSSQNQAKSIESQSYPLQVFLYLVLETGPEYTAKSLAILSAWLGISENRVSVVVCPAVLQFSHICLFYTPLPWFSKMFLFAMYFDNNAMIPAWT